MVMLFFGACFVGFVLMQWQFRTGWRLKDEQSHASPALRDLTFRLHYAALPGIVGTGAMTLLSLLVGPLENALPNSPGVVILPLVAVMFASCVWMLKEFSSPSDSRTPEWLREPRARR